MSTPVPIQYCPRCSAYNSDPSRKACHRCGADLRSELERKMRRDAEAARRSQLVQGPFRAVTGLSCGICGEAVEVLSKETRDHYHKGRMTGSGPSGEEHALTRARITFQPWRCQKGHMFFSSFSVEWREVCPRCRDPVNPFARLVLSCPRCRLMVPVEFFEKGDPIEMLENTGYVYRPSLEGKGPSSGE
ncbi:MAG: hypothetical protein QCI82_07535 [Candidatus Thermoplasmatota archaeon]|nr:hypothetical protein [Candidatus Thermoplasmatota archaeon]